MWVRRGLILDIIKLSYLRFVFQAHFSWVLNETFISGTTVELVSLPLCVLAPLLPNGAEDSVGSGLVETFAWRWATSSALCTRDSVNFPLSKDRTCEINDLTVTTGIFLNINNRIWMEGQAYWQTIYENEMRQFFSIHPLSHVQHPVLSTPL